MAFSSSFSKKINKSKSSSSLLSTNSTNTTTANNQNAATNNANNPPLSITGKPTVAAQATPVKNLSFLSKASHSYSLNKILANASHMLNSNNSSIGGHMNRTTSPSITTTGGSSRPMRMSDGGDDSSPQRQQQLHPLPSYRYENTPAAFFDPNSTPVAADELTTNNNGTNNDDENIFYNVNNFPMSSHNKHRRRDRFLNKLGVKKKPPSSEALYSTSAGNINNVKYGLATQSPLTFGGGSSSKTSTAGASSSTTTTASSNKQVNEAYTNYMKSFKNMKRNNNNNATNETKEVSSDNNNYNDTVAYDRNYSSVYQSKFDFFSLFYSGTLVGIVISYAARTSQ
jgi:hypothetical protein